MNTPTPRTTPLLAVATALLLLVAACGSDSEAQTADVQTADDDGGTTTDGSTAPAEASVATGTDYLGSYTLADEEFGTMVTVTVDGDTRTIETNALPDHTTGEFPNEGNPNTITEQDLTWEFPVEATHTGEATEVRTSGVAVNGLKFEPGTAETLTCESGETYRIEALQDVYDLGLDFNNAHVQPTGEYHYHGISQLLVEAYETDGDLVLVGFAADGHLMYYSKSGAYESSYVLSTDDRSGTGCVASGPGSDTIDVDGTSPDGTYDRDWVYARDAGDLDQCNGVTIDGEYAYIVTDEYPYVTRCVMGEASGAGVGGPPAGGEQGGGEDAAGQAADQAGAPGDRPDLGAAAATLGITETDLQAALGGPPPDVDAAAATLGISVDQLEAALAQAR